MIKEERRRRVLKVLIDNQCRVCSCDSVSPSVRYEIRGPVGDNRSQEYSTVYTVLRRYDTMARES